jgi:phage FluMu protein Com
MQAKRCDNCNKKLFEFNNLTILCEKAKERQEALAISCPRCKIINRVTVFEPRNVNKPA